MPAAYPLGVGRRGAAHGYGHALFYCLGGYTPRAIEVAEATEVALFRYDLDGTVQPVSSHAVALSGGLLQLMDPGFRAKLQRTSARGKA